MITTIILSKDRPAQLDLLLRSIERNGCGEFDMPIVISPNKYDPDPIYGPPQRGYCLWESEPYVTFEFLVRAALWGEPELMPPPGEFVCFMCDDGILYRDYTKGTGIYPEDWLADEETLCFSLRLGQNARWFYPAATANTMPTTVPWKWDSLNWTQHGDFYYPGSIDGHIFRTADVRQMLEGKSFPNPTALECALVEGCNELATERPLMACYPHSVYVGNPINRVSEQSGVRYGTTYPVTAEECNRRFLAGERIDLERMDFSHVNGAHTEIDLKWKQSVAEWLKASVPERRAARIRDGVNGINGQGSLGSPRGFESRLCYGC